MLFYGTSLIDKYRVLAFIMEKYSYQNRGRARLLLSEIPFETIADIIRYGSLEINQELLNSYNLIDSGNLLYRVPDVFSVGVAYLLWVNVAKLSIKHPCPENIVDYHRELQSCSIKGECAVCLDEKVSLLRYRTCRHRVCETCHKKLDVSPCPICRNNDIIDSIEKLSLMKETVPDYA